MEAMSEQEEMPGYCEEEDAGEEWPVWILSGPLSLFFALLSTYGNLVSLRILRNLRVRKSVRFYLSALAVANACLAQTTLYYYAISESLKPFTGIITFFQHVTVFVHPISSFCVALSVWMVLTVTIDRYFALVRPLQHRAYDSRSRAQFFTLLIVIFAIIFSVPAAFELRADYECNKYLVNATMRVLPTALRLDKTYMLLYTVTAFCIFIYIGPLCLMTLLSLRMLCVVYTARKLRNNTTSLKFSDHRGNSENTTVMLLTVVVKFLICNIPSALINVWERVSDENSNLPSTPVFKYCVEISNLLVVINSASDSFVYLRWKRKQSNNVTYSAIPKTLFTADEASQLRSRYNMQKRCLPTLTSILFTGVECLDPNAQSEQMRGTIDVMMGSIGDPIEEQKLITTLNELGANNSNVSIPPASWNKFKDQFIKEFSNGEDSKIWSRFVCLLIKEFRLGQSEVAQRTRSAKHSSG